MYAFVKTDQTGHLRFVHLWDVNYIFIYVNYISIKKKRGTMR